MSGLVLPDAGGVTWSVLVQTDEGMPVGAVGAESALRTASVGKVLLLLETARAVTEGEVSGDELLTRTVDEWVADSGLWHTMAVESLPVTDVAALVGAVSDNLATNVLLRRIGLDAVARRAVVLGLRATALHDRVRDVRTTEHAATLSTGSAAELAGLMARVAASTAVSPAADALVRQWLSANVDLSMVGSVLVEQAGVDPIAHSVVLARQAAADSSVAGHAPGLVLWNKTGTDDGVRADVGAVTRHGRTVTWAAIANWSVAGGRGADRVEAGPAFEAAGAAGMSRADLTTWAVLRGMRQVGELVLDTVTA